jgi:hypothetical protein
LAEVGDEYEAVFAEVAEGLGLGGESVEVIVGGLDFDDASLGILEQLGLGTAALAFWLREQSPVGDACAAVANLGRKEDRRLQGLADRVEQGCEGRVVGGLGGGRAGGADGAEFGDVLGHRIGGGHAGFMIARAGGGDGCGVWFGMDGGSLVGEGRSGAGPDRPSFLAFSLEHFRHD